MLQSMENTLDSLQRQRGILDVTGGEISQCFQSEKEQSPFKQLVPLLSAEEGVCFLGNTFCPLPTPPPLCGKSYFSLLTFAHFTNSSCNNADHFISFSFFFF